MTGPYGPIRTDGGYQGPRTNAVMLQRGQPVKRGRWQIGTREVTLELVPMVGGRPELYELAMQINDPDGRYVMESPGAPAIISTGKTVYVPCMLRGHDWARQAFALTASELDNGTVPDQVLTAPGTPLGP